MKKSILFLFAVLLFFACKKEASESAIADESSTELVEIEKDFVEFYDRFHEDSTFQLTAISFPLHADGDLITWTEENWILHQPFNDYGDKFRREFTPAGRLVFERIYDANGFFNMNRRWAKLSDGWKLIYYKIDEFDPSAIPQ